MVDAFTGDESGRLVSGYLETQRRTKCNLKFLRRKNIALHFKF